MSFLLLSVANASKPKPGVARTARANFTLRAPIELRLAGTAPAADATATVKQVPDIHMAATAPAAGAELTVKQVPDLHFAAQAPAAIGAFETLSKIDLTVTGVAAPAQTAFTMTWTVVPVMRLDVLDPNLDRAPTTVTIALSDAFVGQDVIFAIDGTDVTTLTADSTGAVGPVSLMVTEDLQAGDHTITATQPGAVTATATFNLARSPVAFPTTPTPDPGPVIVPDPGPGVRKWVLQDPGGLGTYVMPISPTSMSSPHTPKVLEAMPTTGVAGTFHVFEGSAAPHEWQLVGYCPDKAMYDQLRAYGELNRRFYVIDHRARVWTVTFQNVDLVMRRRQARADGTWNDWAADYTITALIYDRDWSMPA